jgi:hypothetical protein
VTGAPWDRRAIVSSETTRGFAMPHFEPTVRQLQPLGRRSRSGPIVAEHVDAHAGDAEIRSPDLTTGAPARPLLWRRWLKAHANPFS